MLEKNWLFLAPELEWDRLCREGKPGPKKSPLNLEQSIGEETEEPSELSAQECQSLERDVDWSRFGGLREGPGRPLTWEMVRSTVKVAKKEDDGVLLAGSDTEDEPGAGVDGADIRDDEEGLDAISAQERHGAGRMWKRE